MLQRGNLVLGTIEKPRSLYGKRYPRGRMKCITRKISHPLACMSEPILSNARGAHATRMASSGKVSSRCAAVRPSRSCRCWLVAPVQLFARAQSTRAAVRAAAHTAPSRLILSVASGKRQQTSSSSSSRARAHHPLPPVLHVPGPRAPDH